MTEEVRQNLYVLPSVASQLADFWRVMPVPELFPWTQVGLYRAAVNVTSADDLFSFLEADVIFAAEPGSGDAPREMKTRPDELDPELSAFYQRDPREWGYPAADEVF